MDAPQTTNSTLVQKGQMMSIIVAYKYAANPQDTTVDAIEGSVLMRTFCLPDDVIGCFLEKVPDYVADLVDDQLHHHEPSRQLDD